MTESYPKHSGMHYSFVVPIYRDAALLAAFCAEFHCVFSAFLDTQDITAHAEVIAVCDGGGQDDEQQVRSLCQEHPFLKAVFLSRNFGQHLALSAGYSVAQGRITGMTNVDQQDPIAELPKFIRYMEKNQLDIVYGLRKERKSSLIDRITSHAFNTVLNHLTGNRTPHNVSTMRIMSRRFLDAYNQLSERDRYLPGLEHWLGFDVGFVDTIHLDRSEGQSSYTFRKRLGMAVNSILSFSDYPLKVIAVFGFALSLIGFISVLLVIWMSLFIVEFRAGYPSLISLITLFSGVIICVSGLSSLYIGRILKEVQQRPPFIIKESIKI